MLDQEREAYVSEIVICSLAEQAELYGMYNVIPQSPSFSPLIELLGYMRHFDSGTRPIAFEDQMDETWEEELNGKARSVLSGKDETVGGLLSAVYDRAAEWGLAYLSDKFGYPVTRFNTDDGFDYAIGASGSEHTVEVFRRRPDSTNSLVSLNIDDIPKLRLNRSASNLPRWLRFAYQETIKRIDAKIDRTKTSLDIVAVDITNRPEGFELAGISMLSNTRHFGLQKQIGQALRMSDANKPSILLYTRHHGDGHNYPAVAMPYNPKFSMYGMLGASAVNIRPLEPSDLF